MPDAPAPILLPVTLTPDPSALCYRPDPTSPFRVKFSARIDFTNGGHAAVEDFLLDLPDHSGTIGPARLAEMAVSAMNLLRAGPVTISAMAVVARGAHDDAASPVAGLDAAAIRALYGEPRSLAALKTLDRIDGWARRFIALSPFCVIASSDLAGHCDATPRGDAPGFVTVLDDHTLAIPDRKGNNRVDTLLNIASNPRLGLLFMIPGVRETFRVNGTARIVTDAGLLAPMTAQGKVPASAIVVTVEEAFFHCGKALIRSDLWNPDLHAAPGTIPPVGRIVAEQVGGIDPAVAEADTLVAYVERLY